MGGEDHLIRARHPFQQHADQIGAFARRGVAHGVGNVDRGGAGLDRDLHHAAQVVMLGPGGIHGRPLHIVAQVARMGHGLLDAFGHLVHGQVGNGAVQRRGADEGVDARAASACFTASQQRSISLKLRAAAARRSYRFFGALRDLADGGEIALRGDGKARLDDIHTHLVQQSGRFPAFRHGSWWRRATARRRAGWYQKSRRGSCRSFLMSLYASLG